MEYPGIENQSGLVAQQERLQTFSTEAGLYPESKW